MIITTAAAVNHTGRMILLDASPWLPQRAYFYGIRGGLAFGNVLPGKNDDFHPCGNACHFRLDFLSEVT